MRNFEEPNDRHHTYTPFGQRVHKLEDPYNWEEQRDFEKVFQFYWYLKRAACRVAAAIIKRSKPIENIDIESHQSKMKDSKLIIKKAAE